MNQAFFTLSVGIGSMAIFGSYIGKERSLLGESVNIIVLDTFVAIVAGLIIFPACFTYGVEVNAGPSLLFDTMATVFRNMAGGRWWGTLFSCLWYLPPCPPCWPSAKIFWPWSGRSLAGNARLVAWCAGFWCLDWP